MKNFHPLEFLIAVVLIWIVAANLTFSLRHPWATQTHKMLCVVEIATFQHVTKEDCGE